MVAANNSVPSCHSLLLANFSVTSLGYWPLSEPVVSDVPNSLYQLSMLYWRQADRQEGAIQKEAFPEPCCGIKGNSTQTIGYGVFMHEGNEASLLLCSVRLSAWSWVGVSDPFGPDQGGLQRGRVIIWDMSSSEACHSHSKHVPAWLWAPHGT